MGKQLTQDGTGARIEWHLEVEIELVLGAIGAQAGERKPLALGPHGVDFDHGERLELGTLHGQPPVLVRDTPLPGGVKPSRGDYISERRCQKAVGRRGIKEYRAPEALALIAADREHTHLVCPSCGTRSIQRVPRRRSHGGAPLVSERVTLTCQTCGRHASYIERGGVEAPRDSTMDPHPLASKEP